MINHLPVIILAIVKLTSPATPIVDPKRNPTFFIFTVICLNAEWYIYSLVFMGIIEPIVNALNKQSDRKALTAISRIGRIAKQLPVVDLILRLVLVVPALVVAARDNDTLVIWVYFSPRTYGFAKYIAFGAT